MLQAFIQLCLAAISDRANLSGGESYSAVQIGALQVRTTNVRTAQDSSLKVGAA